MGRRCSVIDPIRMGPKAAIYSRMCAALARELSMFVHGHLLLVLYILQYRGRSKSDKFPYPHIHDVHPGMRWPPFWLARHSGD